jgi:hypothetical protein
MRRLHADFLVTRGYIFVTRCSQFVTDHRGHFSLRETATSHAMKLHILEGNRAARTCDPVDSRIRSFLWGRDNGVELFDALYGHVNREAIPERLAALLPTDMDEPLVAVAAS